MKLERPIMSSVSDFATTMDIPKAQCQAVFALTGVDEEDTRLALRVLHILFVLRPYAPIEIVLLLLRNLVQRHPTLGDGLRIVNRSLLYLHDGATMSCWSLETGQPADLEPDLPIVEQLSVDLNLMTALWLSRYRRYASVHGNGGASRS